MRFVINFKIAAVISAVMFFSSVSFATPWELTAPLNQPRGRIAATVLNGEIYVIGGNTTPGVIFDTVEKFHPDSAEWITVTSLNHPRAYAAAASVNGYIYVFGGRIDAATPEYRVEKYDPLADEWIDVAEMGPSTALAREGLQAIVVDDLIWLLGGYTTATGYLGNVDVFDPATETFITPKASLEPVVGHAAVTDGSTIRVIGGQRFGVLREHLSYADPLWVYEEAMLDVRMDLGAAISGDSLMAIGGSNGVEPLNSVEFYRFSTGYWYVADTMNFHRETHAAVKLNGDIYAIGGYGGDGSRLDYLTSVEKLTACVSVGIKDKITLSPHKTTLKCYPNPFNSQLSIEFDSSGNPLKNSRLSIFNSLGQLVYDSGLGDAGNGVNSVIWQGTDNHGNQLSSGLYYVQIGGNIDQAIKPIVLLR